MIPEKLAQRLRELGENPEDVYNTRMRKAHLGPGQEKVPWVPDASYDGLGYTFDPVSAVPVLALEPKANERILDMCAAPGTKTILIARMTHNAGNIVANDVNRKRILRLRENLERNKINATITNVSGASSKIILTKSFSMHRAAVKVLSTRRRNYLIHGVREESSF